MRREREVDAVEGENERRKEEETPGFTRKGKILPAQTPFNPRAGGGLRENHDSSLVLGLIWRCQGYQGGASVYDI